MTYNTPLYKINHQSMPSLYIKRDDLFPITGGGNKGRKAQLILKKCIEDGCNAVVTCGGIQSNHTRATAIRCKELGLACTIVIHAKPIDKLKGNLKLLALLGVRVVYCEMQDVSRVMDDEMMRFSRFGYKPFYIWGGGHCYEGTLSYFDAVKELRAQSDVKFDAVFVASGTGATQAGLHCGFRYFYPQARVYGISVARDKSRGFQAVSHSVEEFIKNNNLPLSYLNDIFFSDSAVCGGYEKISKELIHTIKDTALKTGVMLDPTYTGKAWLGMEKHIKERVVKPDANILFWHTGGLLNLMAANEL